MSLRDAAVQALEALTFDGFTPEDATHRYYTTKAITALRAALAEPEQPEPVVDGNTSDGYHTFNELYAFRMAYNAALFNEWALTGKYQVHKSLRHYDGEPCFDGNYFVVVAMLPGGQITNHYELRYWDEFKVPETEKARFPFDGHTASDVLYRLQALATVEESLPVQQPEPVKQKQEKQMKKIELDGDTADRITVLNLKEYLNHLNKALEEQGAYMHPDDLRHNRMIIPALEMVIHDFGGDDE